jgi:hypothetical protein
MAMAANAAVPPLHSRRVEAWVHSVLNPIIEGLGREQFLLERGDLSWRSYSRGCEYIRPIAQYIGPSQVPNLEDFLDDPENSGFAAQFSQHDQSLGKLESSVKRFFEELTKSASFAGEVSSALQEHATGPHSSQSYSATMTDEAVAKYVGEYLINNIENLPQHYGLYEFWSQNRERFRRSAESIEFREQRESFCHAVKEVREISRGLLSHLKDHRRRLCTTFDIPAAPFPNEQVIGA